MVVATVALAGPLQAATFTVTNISDDGPGSLRQAIVDANNAAGADQIHFDIPAGSCSAAGVCTIVLAANISIEGEVLVDGATQRRHGAAPANVCATLTDPSSMRVEILGPVAGDRLLTVNSPGVVSIRGLSLGLGWGISIQTAGEHRFSCNHFGIDGTGQTSLGSGTWGVVFEGLAEGAIIGTDGDGVDDLAERNVFGGCGYGVYINGNASNWIAGNYFGSTADGTGVISNTNGVFVRQNSRDNLIGSDLDGVSDDLERNVFAAGFELASLDEWSSSTP